MENYKLYVDTDKPSVKIKFSISYLKPSESINWATNQYREPGYRITAVPVERSDDGRMESFTAFTGFGDTLLPCKRRSKKRYEQSVRKLKENMPRYITWFDVRGYIISEEFKKDIVKFSNF